MEATPAWAAIGAISSKWEEKHVRAKTTDDMIEESAGSTYLPCFAFES